MIESLSLDHPNDFIFDVEQLKTDYQSIKLHHPAKVSFMLTFVTPESALVQDNIWDRTYLSRLYEPHIFKMPFTELFAYNHAKLSMANFHVMMRDTYTHKMLMSIDAQLKLEGKRISYVEYHELPPGACYPMHSDINDTRYHLPITTNQYAFFTIEQTLGQGDFKMNNMPQCGRVYQLKVNTYHTAVNAGTEPRIHLMYDVVDL